MPNATPETALKEYAKNLSEFYNLDYEKTLEIVKEEMVRQAVRALLSEIPNASFIIQN